MESDGREAGQKMTLELLSPTLMVDECELCTRHTMPGVVLCAHALKQPQCNLCVTQSCAVRWAAGKECMFNFLPNPLETPSSSDFLTLIVRGANVCVHLSVIFVPLPESRCERNLNNRLVI